MVMSKHGPVVPLTIDEYEKVKAEEQELEDKAARLNAGTKTTHTMPPDKWGAHFQEVWMKYKRKSQDSGDS